jgi:hypothetical protein
MAELSSPPVLTYALNPTEIEENFKRIEKN